MLASMKFLCKKRSKQLPSHAGNQAFFENFSVLAHALGHPFPTLSGLIIVCARVDHVECFSNSEAELVGRHGFVGVDSSAEQWKSYKLGTVL